MELKGYIFPKNAVFRYAFFPYGVLFGAFVALHLELQQDTQLHFYTFSVPVSTPVLPLSGTIFPASIKWYLTPLLTVCKRCPVLLPQGRQLLPYLPPFAAIFGGAS